MSDVESDYEEEETKHQSEKNGTKSKNDDADNDGEDDETSVSGSEAAGETDESEVEDEDDDEFEEEHNIDRMLGEETNKKKTASKKSDVKPAYDTLLNSIFGNAQGDDEEEDIMQEGEDPENMDAYDEEEYGFKYLQKFDNDTRKQIIDEFHREALQHSYEEIEAMCCVVRTPDGVIDALHRTPPFLTKYEKARILGERARQLGAGAKPFIDLEPDVIDEYTIAVMEMQQGKLPFIIKRPLPNGGCEYWRLADLEIL